MLRSLRFYVVMDIVPLVHASLPSIRDINFLVLWLIMQRDLNRAVEIFLI